MRAPLFVLIGLALLLSVLWGRQSGMGGKEKRGGQSPVTSDERAGGKTGLPPKLIENQAAARLKNGERLARLACQTCHLFPEPALLDKKTWSDYVLPNMQLYLGLSRLEDIQEPQREMFRSAGVIPPAPLISRSDWEQIVHYYQTTAPGQMPAQAEKEEIKLGLPGFVVEPPRFRHSPPLTTLVDIDPVTQRIYMADATTQSLHILDSNGVPIQNIPVGNIAVSLSRAEQGLYLACIGHFFPEEEKRGQVILLERTGEGYRRKVLLSELHRPAHLELADLNGNGKLDFVLSQFGYLTGRLSWFENLGGDEYREHLLFPKAGAIRTVVKDFNGDGYPDIAALFGQETEALIIFYGNEKGGFTSREVFRKPPSYGHTYFEMADFNGNGLPDFLVTNGDNGDYHSPPKSYHGVRIYLNQGNDVFEESFFYPMHGAFKAVARDFDGDGNLDIAAISFFPDYEKAPRESFVFLKNHGGLNFSAYTFPECISGRWLTMDAADLDGDGGIDIVLGSLIGMNTEEVPPFLLESWQKGSPSVLILRNTLHQDLLR
jgi:hypothetical protein